MSYYIVGLSVCVCGLFLDGVGAECLMQELPIAFSTDYSVAYRCIFVPCCT